MKTTRGLVIFDFDGTIADSIETITRIYNELASQYGFKIIDREEIKKIRGMTPWKILMDLRQSWISIFKITFLIRKIEYKLAQEIGLLKPFPQIKETVSLLKEQGYSLGIITSDLESIVKNFLDANRMEVFDFIYSSGRIFSKDRLIKNFLNKTGIDKETAYYVGDEIRDIKTAKNAQIHSIAVTWGFASKEALAAQNPDFLIDSPVELIKILK